ncbi:hypothetical protein OEA41_000481 [Lepraria neglecta]|uniref:Uncharacterized protein n=1 Tax=Lepraria neglecta TaxID=209136 RepID=A0AAE0DPH5_9LECA|nr:hypothetical protein OEA41_000481 [Lepraria neglecta]
MIHYLSMSVLALAICSGMSATTKVTFDQGFDTFVVVPDEARLNPIGTLNYVQYTNVDAAQPGALNES